LTGLHRELGDGSWEMGDEKREMKDRYPIERGRR